MDDVAAVAAAVAEVLAPTPSTRLVTIDAGNLIDAGDRAVYAAFGDAVGDGGPRRVVADVLRLPLIAGMADAVVARHGVAGEPDRLWREIWRVLAPAGCLVIVVDLPTSQSVASLLVRGFAPRRIARRLDAAMFTVVVSRRCRSALIVRAVKRDGLAHPPPVTHAALRPAVS